MELQEMKKLWQSTPTEHVPVTSLQQMTLEKSQPMLKKIKFQLVFEMIVWTTIVAFYHNVFDGDKLPVAINLVFVAGFLQAIVYNISAYLAARNLSTDMDLRASLDRNVGKLIRFKWTAICSRAVLMLAIMVFFSYGLEMNTKRLGSMAGIAVLFGIQLMLIWKSWNKRVDALSSITEDLDDAN